MAFILHVYFLQTLNGFGQVLTTPWPSSPLPKNSIFYSSPISLPQHSHERSSIEDCLCIWTSSYSWNPSSSLTARYQKGLGVNLLQLGWDRTGCLFSTLGATLKDYQGEFCWIKNSEPMPCLFSSDCWVLPYTVYSLNWWQLSALLRELDQRWWD